MDDQIFFLKCIVVLLCTMLLFGDDWCWRIIRWFENRVITITTKEMPNVEAGVDVNLNINVEKKNGT